MGQLAGFSNLDISLNKCVPAIHIWGQFVSVEYPYLTHVKSTCDNYWEKNIMHSFVLKWIFPNLYTMCQTTQWIHGNFCFINDSVLRLALHLVPNQLYRYVRAYTAATIVPCTATDLLRGVYIKVIVYKSYGELCLFTMHNIHISKHCVFKK